MKPHDVIPRDLDSPGPEGSALSAAGGLRLAASGLLLVFLACGFVSCQAKPAVPTIGVAFETLQTEFWVAAIDAVHAVAWGQMVALQGGEIVRVPLAEAVGTRLPFPACWP